MAGLALAACAGQPGTPAGAAGVAPASASIDESAVPVSASAVSSSPKTTTSPLVSATPGTTGAPTPASVSSSPPPPPSPASTSVAAPPAGAPVHLRLYQNDGQTYGVGMPIIMYLSKVITDGKPLTAATTVTVNGRRVDGAWFFQKSAIYPDYPMEAHYRAEKFWPAHATIALDLSASGISSGKNLLFDNDLTLTIKTGAANITTVDGSTERLITTTDGAQKFNFPVSLGKATTPTFTGTKIVMQRDRVKRMIGTTPGDLYDLQVPWSVRLTNSGEFIHAASWNGGNIGQRSTSNGCTNLNVDAALQYFNFAQIGDVAIYHNTGGGPMPVWDGYGDWNTPWASWRRGGAVSTS